MKQKVLVIVGQTAAGKSDLAVDVAHKIGGEVISADSRQVYRGLDHGSGKITRREMRGVRHHLLDVADPARRYTVEDYRRDTQAAIMEIASRGKVPIICGGTMFYIDAALSSASFPDVKPDEKLRNSLAKKSARALFSMLRKLDPRRAKTIDPNNKVRLIRAIEIARVLGRVPVAKPKKLYDALTVGISWKPEELRARIEKRLDRRWTSIIREVKRLRTQGVTWKRLHELGLEYRYVSLYVRGQMTRDEARQKLLSEIWHYARRQMSWWRRQPGIHWFPLSKKEQILREVQKFAKSC